eukprot:scaffold8973_cov75-Skeletonema_dohrnii-CCMP3373.AAC.5
MREATIKKNRKFQNQETSGARGEAECSVRLMPLVLLPFNAYSPFDDNDSAPLTQRSFLPALNTDSYRPF